MTFKITILINEGVLPEYAVALHNRLIEKFGLQVNIEVLPGSSKHTFTGIFFSDTVLLRKHRSSLTSSTATAENQNRIIINLSGKEQNESTIGPSIILQCSVFNQNAIHVFPELIKAFSRNQSTFTSEIIAQTQNKKRVISSGCYKLIPHSYRQSLETAIRETTNLFLQSVGTIISGNNTDPGSEPNNTVENKLSISSISHALFNIGRNRIKKRIQQLFFIDKWNTGQIKADLISVALEANKKWQVSWDKECSGSDFIADPFLTNLDGNTYLYYEHLQNKTGSIGFQSFDGKYEQSKINTQAHLSYPYTFNHAGEHYLLPEQNENNCIILYKLNKNTGHAEEPRILIKDFRGVDPSIIYYDNTFWLFCTDGKDKGADIRLHIFYSASLEGPWIAHRMNPVKSDIRSARPAGHLFVHDGRLYRPSQDSSTEYGGSIQINRIDLISTTAFQETPVNRITPDCFNGPYTKGVHTISGTGNSTYIDGKRRIFRPFKIFSN